ncbi:MAG: hypothetical protein ABGX07_22960 [Pirellulaceae bacterium]
MTFTQPDVSSNDATDSSPDLAGCISVDELQNYLVGWSDDDQSQRIENHIAACSGCDLALRNLDIRPDPLMQSLQSTAVDSVNRDENIAGTHDKGRKTHAMQFDIGPYSDD